MKYLIVIVALLVTPFVFGQSKNETTNEISTTEGASTLDVEAYLDSIFHQAYPSHSPGATVLIAKDDKVLYRKAFGMANLELNVPMNPENVLHLASITKQFTSVAILMLMEEGKLNLKDPLSKYVPDFPRGNEITIHNLLNHSSGIKDYTRIPEFRAKTRLDLAPEEIIESFKNLSLEFNPNEKYDYSNSGYVLLGHIIEQLSGLSYGEFIQKNIFDPLGMKNSQYADIYRITPKKAYGYQLYEGNYENPEYMSPTFPYAAGSLMSTVDDMYLWYQAIKNNTLISEESKRFAFSNHQLSSGKKGNYGYGWFINEIAGVSTIEHTGGINGFTTSGIFVPEKNIYSIVLTNNDDGKGPESYNIKAVSAMLGKPILDKTQLKVSGQEMEKWVGAYQFEDVIRFISYENGELISTREGGRPIKLVPLSVNEFRFENGLSTYTFSLQNGIKQVLYSDRINKSIGIETDKKPATEREFINLSPDVLTQYVGVYELQPGFQVEIELQADHLRAKAGGQPPIILFAESKNCFFIKEMGARVVFNLNEEGTVKSLSFSQGGNTMEGKKLK